MTPVMAAAVSSTTWSEEWPAATIATTAELLQYLQHCYSLSLTSLRCPPTPCVPLPYALQYDGDRQPG
jgi:hypothetical protein